MQSLLNQPKIKKKLNFWLSRKIRAKQGQVSNKIYIYRSNFLKFNLMTIHYMVAYLTAVVSFIPTHMNHASY